MRVADKEKNIGQGDDLGNQYNVMAKTKILRNN